MGWIKGTFKRIHDWTTDEANGVNILSTRMDEEDDNFATGIDSCLTKDGSNTPTANLPMGGRRHTGVGLSTSGSIDEYATVKQTQSGTYMWCGTTAGSLNAYTVTPLISPAAYATGQKFWFKANRTNSGATTLDVSGLGARAVWYNGAACTGDEITADRIYGVVFDGTRFQLVGGGSGSGSSFGGAKVYLTSNHFGYSASWTTIPAHGVVYNTDDAYYTANNDYFVIPTDGRYRVTGSVNVIPVTFEACTLMISLRKNSSRMDSSISVAYLPEWIANSSARLGVTTLWEGVLEENDQISLQGNQTSAGGSSLNFRGSATIEEACYMAIERIY